ncbi:MAG: hypothetical protein GY756_20360, partial [bacterium]|nr:hypothetical protein [bacterium]
MKRKIIILVIAYLVLVVSFSLIPFYTITINKGQMAYKTMISGFYYTIIAFKGGSIWFGLSLLLLHLGLPTGILSYLI